MLNKSFSVQVESFVCTQKVCELSACVYVAAEVMEMKRLLTVQNEES